MQRLFLKKAAWVVSLAIAGLAGLVAPSFADVAQGVFVGSAKGIGGDVTVTITVKNGKLAEVEANTGSETPGDAYGRCRNEILCAQMDDCARWPSSPQSGLINDARL